MHMSKGCPICVWRLFDDTLRKVLSKGTQVIVRRQRSHVFKEPCVRVELNAFIQPQWQPPSGVQALMSTRLDGVSRGSFASMNIGDSVGDDPEAVRENLRRFQAALELPVFGGKAVALAPMHQVHGTRVLDLDDGNILQALRVGERVEADASVCTRRGVACMVKTADCMPVLLAAPEGVAAAHAGWRGLAGGVIEATLAKLLSAAHCQAHQVTAWLGPCIGPEHFEVGDDVRSVFIAQHPENAQAFRSSFVPKKWLADLPLLGKLALCRAGVEQVTVDGRCTVMHESLFFSYRRDQKRLGATGRMAACIWLAP